MLVSGCRLIHKSMNQRSENMLVQTWCRKVETSRWQDVDENEDSLKIQLTDHLMMFLELTLMAGLLLCLQVGRMVVM